MPALKTPCSRKRPIKRLLDGIVPGSPCPQNRLKNGDKSRYIETIIVHYIAINSPIFADHFNDFSDKSGLFKRLFSSLSLIVELILLEDDHLHRQMWVIAY